MTLFYRIAAGLMILLGIAHTALTGMFYDTLTVDTLWYVGTGIGTIVLGFFNLVNAMVPPRPICGGVILSNLLFTVYFGIVIAVLGESQAWIAGVLALACLSGSVVPKKNGSAAV